MNTPSLEHAVIGGMIADIRNYRHAKALGVDETTFFEPRLRHIWRVLDEMCSKGLIPNLLSIHAKMPSEDAAGWQDLLTECVDQSAPHFAMFAQHLAEQLQSLKSTRLRLRMDEWRKDLKRPDRMQDVISEIRLEIRSITPPAKSTSLHEATDAELLAIDQAKSRGSYGIPVRWLELSDIIHGIPKKEATMLSARPGIGKTSFGLNICTYVASPRHNIPVGIVSLEMAAGKLLLKMASDVGSIDIDRFRSGEFEPEDRQRLHEKLQMICKWPFYIVEGPMTIHQIVNWMDHMVSEHGVELFLVDYLQLIRSTRGKNMTQDEEIGRQLGDMLGCAKENNVSLLILSQLNRSGADLGNAASHQMRGSGSIEQDAHTTILLDLPRGTTFEDLRVQFKDQMPVIVKVDKNRSGRVGEVKFTFDKRYSRYEIETSV